MTHLSRRFVLTGLATAVAVSRLPLCRPRASRPDRSSSRRCPMRRTRWNRISTRAPWKSITTATTRLTSNNMNGFAKDNPMLGERPIVEILAKLSDVPEAVRTGVRNNLGGHANHSMFWEIMGPGGGKPDGELAAAITRDLGGMEKFQNDFNGAGGRVFGSGWVFVTVTPRRQARHRKRSPTRTRR